MSTLYNFKQDQVVVAISKRKCELSLGDEVRGRPLNRPSVSSIFQLFLAVKVISILLSISEQGSSRLPETRLEYTDTIIIMKLIRSITENCDIFKTYTLLLL